MTLKWEPQLEATTTEEEELDYTNFLRLYVRGTTIESNDISDNIIPSTVKSEPKPTENSKPKANKAESSSTSSSGYTSDSDTYETSESVEEDSSSTSLTVTETTTQIPTTTIAPTPTTPTASLMPSLLGMQSFQTFLNLPSFSITLIFFYYGFSNSFLRCYSYFFEDTGSTLPLDSISLDFTLQPEREMLLGDDLLLHGPMVLGEGVFGNGILRMGMMLDDGVVLGEEVTFGTPSLLLPSSPVGEKEENVDGENEKERKSPDGDPTRKRKRKRQKEEKKEGKDADGEGKGKDRRKRDRGIPEVKLPDVVSWGVPNIELWEDKHLIVETLSHQAQEGDVQTPVSLLDGDRF